MSRSDRRLASSAVAVGVAIAVLSGHGAAATAGSAAGSKAPAGSAAQAISFARQQIGKPYVYGATGPGAYDCSGLVQAAWASASVPIPRTSEEQWAQLPHVSHLQPGDLILYTGSPIDPPPGHVTLYIGGGQMIEAYGAGYPIRQVPVRPGAVGYAQPWGA
jgi:cell wall-associated NlpC family hydrolase